MITKTRRFCGLNAHLYQIIENKPRLVSIAGLPMLRLRIGDVKMLSFDKQTNTPNNKHINKQTTNNKEANKETINILTNKQTSKQSYKQINKQTNKPNKQANKQQTNEKQKHTCTNIF